MNFIKYLAGGVFLVSASFSTPSFAGVNSASGSITVYQPTKKIGGLAMAKNFDSWYVVCDGVKWKAVACGDWGSHGARCTYEDWKTCLQKCDACDYCGSCTCNGGTHPDNALQSRQGCTNFQYVQVSSYDGCETCYDVTLKRF